MRIIVFTLLLFACSLTVKAQHCFYDANYIAVLEIKSSENKSVIPNLKIILLDSLDHPIVKAEAYRELDTLHIEQNKDSKFWFAKDNYTIVLELWPGKTLPGNKLKIMDVDGKQNGGAFKTKIIDLESDHFYPLCNDYSRWLKESNRRFVDGYEPIIVKLEEK